MNYLNVRVLFIAVFLPILSVSSLRAEQKEAELIKKVETYFENLKSFQADVLQVNPDRSTAKGKFYLQRPEKFRLEYTEPKAQVILSDGFATIEYDPSENIPNFISLSGTPAGLLLRNKITLSGDASVTSIQENEGILQVNIIKTDDPGIGSMTLIFETKPMRLVYWLIVDSQGMFTEVALKNIKQNEELKKSLFVFPG